MATQITTSKDIILTAPVAKVYASWDLREANFNTNLVAYLRLDQLRIVCGPEIDQAQLSYTYGDIVREDQRTVEYYPPLNLAGAFVKIQIDDTVFADDFSSSSGTATENLPITWYGRIEHNEKTSAGSRDILNTGSSSSIGSSSSASSPHARGTQHFTAFGLLRLLEQEIIDTSYVDLTGSTSASSSSTNLYTVYTGLPFNSDPGGQFVRRGNRSAAKINGTYVYSWEPRGFDTWSAYNAVEYLLAHQVPLKNGGSQANVWRLDADIDCLDWYDIDVKTNGRTVKSVLDELIPRQRGIGYYVDFDNTNDQIVLHAFTFTNVDITLPSGKVLKANPNQRSLDFETALDVIDATVTDTMLSSYHRIIVRGDKRTTTFTASLEELGPYYTEAFCPAWSSDDESEYILAASSAPDYSSLTTIQKQARNAIYRSSPRLEEVFRKFKLNQNTDANRWLGTSYDILGVGTHRYAIRGDQKVEPYSSIDDSGNYGTSDYVPSLRLMRSLPLYENYDYSDTKLSTFSYGTAFSANKHPSFIPPFVFAKTSKITTSSSSASPTYRYEMLDRLHRSWASAGDRTWSARLTINDTEPGFEINASVPHFLAGVSTVGWAVMADHENQSINKGIPYTDCYVTVCVELNEQVQWEEVLAEPVGNAPEQVLIIPIHGARFDYVVPYTVVDIKDGIPVQTTSGGFAKNDMTRLKSIAKAASQWYSQERQTLDLAFRQVRAMFKLGWLITDIGQRYDRKTGFGVSSSAGLTSINTPITGITYTLGNGNEAGHTRLETGFVNLDFDGRSQ